MATIEIEKIKNGKVIRNKVYSGPSKWEEMNKQHLITWASTMCSDLKVLVAKKVLAAQLYKISSHTLAKVLGKKDQFRLSLSIGFLFGENRLHQWVMPSFWFRFKKYYGPKSKLSNLTAEEFTLCEFCYEQFELKGSVKYLDHLAAILYRPRRWFNIDNDIRTDLRTISYEKRAVRFAKLPNRMRYAIYLNYEGCRNFIIKNNPEIFKKEKGKGSAKEPKVTPWSRIVQNGAGGIFGTLKETEKSNVHKFLSELNARLKESRENQQP